MAERRMFAKSVIDSDAFLDMPLTARLLYYDLGMRADDDGFVGSPRKIMRMIGASQDDLLVLIAKQYVIPFDSGVVVIKHWKQNNYLRNDRHTGTVYKTEFATLKVMEDNTYEPLAGSGIPNGNRLVDERYTQDRIGKDRLVKDNNIIADSGESSGHKKTALEAEFDEIWKLYPKKNGRKKAEQYYIKARKNGVEKATIEEAIKNYTEFCKRTNRYFADGSTWFNQARWEDDYSIPYDTQAQPRQETMAERLERLRKEGRIDFE